MRTAPRRLVAAAALVTVATLVTWLATDRHVYTKFAVVEEVERPVADDDPLAETGFYDGPTRRQIVRREEFHLGLLPTPRTLLDKHALSVLSLVGPAWALALGLRWWTGRRSRRFRPAAQEA